MEITNYTRQLIARHLSIELSDGDVGSLQSFATRSSAEPSPRIEVNWTADVLPSKQEERSTPLTLTTYRCFETCRPEDFSVLRLPSHFYLNIFEI